MTAGSTYTPISTTTLGVDTPSYTFSSISGSYTDLILILNGASTAASNIQLQFNSDTATNYSYNLIYGTGSIAGAGRTSTSFAVAGYMPSGTISTTIINFQNYSNSTTFKTLLSRENTANAEVGAYVNLWRSTSAINSIKVYPSGGNLAAGMTLTLYGILSA